MSGTLADRLHALVTAPGTTDLVRTFYDPVNGFAGSLFDNLGDNPPDRIVIDDLLAVTLLDVGFRPRAVRGLLEQGTTDGHLGHLLASVPADVPLWDATTEDLQSAERVWIAVRDQTGKGVLAGVGPTHRSKLMARKRPHLVPIVDSVIRSALAPFFNDGSWVPLRDALSRHPQLLLDIEALRPSDGSCEVSTLRVLDTVIWMWCSNGAGARAVRAPYVHPLGNSR